MSAPAIACALYLAIGLLLIAVLWPLWLLSLLAPRDDRRR